MARRGGAGVALLLEPDPLALILVAPAVAALGFSPAWVAAAPASHEPAEPPVTDAAPVAVFVPLGAGADCPHLTAEPAGAAGSRGPRPAEPSGVHAQPSGPSGASEPLLVGYAAGPEGLLSAHRAHACCDLVLRLAAVAGRPRFVYLPAGDAVSTAGLTRREADVLILLLSGLTTAAVAGHLGVSPSTARSHCRAVLRKLGAADRRALRARLLGGPERPRAANLCTTIPEGFARPSESFARPSEGLPKGSREVC